MLKATFEQFVFTLEGLRQVIANSRIIHSLSVDLTDTPTCQPEQGQAGHTRSLIKPIPAVHRAV